MKTREELLEQALVDTQRCLNEALSMPSIMIGGAVAAIIHDNNKILAHLGIKVPDASERVSYE